MDTLDPSDSLALFRLLAHDLRCHLVRSLAQSDARVSELAARVGEAPETIVSELERLRSAGLVTERQSDAPSREMYYQLDLEQLRVRYRAAGAMLHPALVTVSEAPTPSPVRPRVLFLCTHNSVRSQIAEGLMRAMSKGQIDVFSAGSKPSEVHPYALEVLRTHHVDVEELRAKHVDTFAGQTFDYVITVCDRAHETCAMFSGANETMHWSIADPTTVDAPGERYRAFRQVATLLTNRIRYLIIRIEREQRERRAMLA